MSGQDDNPLKAVRRLELAGYGLLALLFGGAGVWASTSQISGAVIAPGSIELLSHVKKVQHPTGGIVASINVHEGDVVKAGQVLVRLDDTVARATVGVVRAQLDELQAREARLTAERDGVDQIAFPAELLARESDKRLMAALASEQKLFVSRRSAKDGQREQLQQRIAEAREEIHGLEAQQKAKEQEIEFIKDELAGVYKLWNENLVAITRLVQLKRDQARLSGERGQYIAAIARAEGKISETRLQIIQLDKDFGASVLKDLREVQGKIAELTERLVAARDQLKRVKILAPQNGVVNQLAVHTVGGVVGNGEVLMEIVPRDDQLIIESKVEPRDIDQVKLGAETVVRVMAGEERANPDLRGKVTLIPADLTNPRTATAEPARPYYKVRVELPKEEVARLGGLKLMSGMQAEVFIQTYPRTPLEYLVKPLKDQMARTFRER